MGRRWAVTIIPVIFGERIFHTSTAYQILFIYNRNSSFENQVRGHRCHTVSDALMVTLCSSGEGQSVAIGGSAEDDDDDGNGHIRVSTESC